MIWLVLILAWIVLSVYLVTTFHKTRTRARSNWMTAMKALKKEYEK